MADKPILLDGKTPAPESTPTPPVPPKRGPGHRGADVKDTVAEMAAKAHEISLEAGSKMAAAMKDVINAAAGLTGFVLESARDLVQYMVRRGQMTQEEADKLIRQAEEAQVGRPAPSSPPKAAVAEKPVKAAVSQEQEETPVGQDVVEAPAKGEKAVAKKPAAKPAEKPAAKKPAAKTAPAAPVAKKAPAKKK